MVDKLPQQNEDLSRTNGLSNETKKQERERAHDKTEKKMKLTPRTNPATRLRITNKFRAQLATYTLFDLRPVTPDRLANCHNATWVRRFHSATILTEGTPSGTVLRHRNELHRKEAVANYVTVVVWFVGSFYESVCGGKWKKKKKKKTKHKQSDNLEVRGVRSALSVAPLLLHGVELATLESFSAARQYCNPCPHGSMGVCHTSLHTGSQIIWKYRNCQWQSVALLHALS